MRLLMTHRKNFSTAYLLFFTLTLLCCSTAVFGQNKVVAGRVLANENDSTLPGTTVSVKGKNISTVTKDDGRFSLSVPPNSILVFSSVGYATQEMPVGNSS